MTRNNFFFPSFLIDEQKLCIKQSSKLTLLWQLIAVLQIHCDRLHTWRQYSNEVNLWNPDNVGIQVSGNLIWKESSHFQWIDMGELAPAKRKVAENDHCQAFRSAGNYKWQCLSLSSWKPFFSPPHILSVWWRSVKWCSAHCPFLHNFIWMIHNRSHQADYGNVLFCEWVKSSSQLQMFFDTNTLGRHTMCATASSVLEANLNSNIIKRTRLKLLESENRKKK